MRTFEFHRPESAASAIAAGAQAKTAQQGADIRFLAGGTTLIDLMKLEVETPGRLLDINRLPFDKIEDLPDGGLKIGATVRNSDLAYHAKVQADYAVLSQAILSGASAQLRNAATTAETSRGSIVARRVSNEPSGELIVVFVLIGRGYTRPRAPWNRAGGFLRYGREVPGAEPRHAWTRPPPT